MARWTGARGELIPRAPFVEILERLIDERADRDHHGNGKTSDPTLGGRMALAREMSAAGIYTEASAQRKLYSILTGEFATLQRETAEKILSSLDLDHLWYCEPKLRRLLPRGRKLTPAERKAERLQRKQHRQNTCVGCGKTIDWSATLGGVRLRFEPRKWARPYCVLCAADVVEIPERQDVTGRTKPIPNKDLRLLYKAYVTEEVGVFVLAERVYQRYGYKSVASCASGLTRYWKSAGLPMRKRNEAKAVNRKLRPRLGKLTKEQVEQAYVIYSRTPTISLNELGKQLYKKLGYKTHNSAAVALGTAFHDHGLEVRGRIEQTVLSSTKNGMSPRNWKERKRRRLEAGLTQYGRQRQPYCVGTKKGKRCKTRAVKGSVYCWSHDPANAEARAAHLEKGRLRSPKQNPLMVTTYAAVVDDLAAFVAWAGGRMRAAELLAEPLGVHRYTVLKEFTYPPERKLTRAKARKLREAMTAITAGEMADEAA